jgi:hypothetical protein
LLAAKCRGSCGEEHWIVYIVEDINVPFLPVRMFAEQVDYRKFNGLIVDEYRKRCI